MAPWLMFGAGIFIGWATLIPLYLGIKHARWLVRIRDYNKPCPCGGGHTKGEGRLSPLYCNRARLPQAELDTLDA